MESILVQLVKEYESYRSGLSVGKEESLLDFTLQLNGVVAKKETQKRQIGHDAWTHLTRITLEEIAGSSIGKMGRYIDFYSKKVLPHTDLSTMDEFTYLILLLQADSLTKSELIQQNKHPITSGTEVIKRLLAKRFIEQFDDLLDKRSVRVRISQSGKVALMNAYKQLGMISKITTSALSNSDLIQLVSLLNKLDAFHEQIYKNTKHSSMEEILLQYHKEE